LQHLLILKSVVILADVVGIGFRDTLIT
jgi:hypothetical protein